MRNASVFVAQETRRHRRLVKKASKLDVRDLLDICAMKGMEGAPRPPAAEGGGGAPSAGAASGDPPALEDVPGPAEEDVPGGSGDQDHDDGADEVDPTAHHDD